MKRAFVVLAVAMVGGCASTAEVMSQSPKEVFRSDRSQNEVAFCLADKNHTTALDRDDGSKVILIKNGYGAVSMAFSVYSEGAGSRVEYRKKFGIVGGIWKQCIGIGDAK